MGVPRSDDLRCHSIAFGRLHPSGNICAQVGSKGTWSESCSHKCSSTFNPHQSCSPKTTKFYLESSPLISEMLFSSQSSSVFQYTSHSSTESYSSFFSSFLSQTSIKEAIRP